MGYVLCAWVEQGSEYRDSARIEEGWEYRDSARIEGWESARVE